MTEPTSTVGDAAVQPGYQADKEAHLGHCVADAVARLVRS